MHSQAITLGSHRRMAAWEVTETYRRDLVVWLQDEGWRDICHCPCVEPSPLWPNLNLHWPNEPHSLYPGDSLGLCCASPNLCTARGSFSGKQLALTPSEVILKKTLKVLQVPSKWWLCLTRVAPDSALAPNLNLHLHGEHHLLHSGDSLRTWLIQLEYHPRLF